MIDEISYLRWIRDRTRLRGPVEVGPGDDAAVLRAEGKEPYLLSVDAVFEGVDFHLEEAGPRAVGRKAMAVGLSDIAAMGGEPTAALASVSSPRKTTREALEALFLGLEEVAEEFSVPLIGGDFTTWDGGLGVTVTCVGRGDPILRSGARVGDAICVTGALGGSILGKHLRFTPRVREARRLREEGTIHAMIDISDGLGRDLHHILEESGVGAVVKAEAIPIAADARRLAEDTGKEPLEHALGDGEDFELLFTLPPGDAERICNAPSAPSIGIEVSRIGEVIESGCWLERDGVRAALPPTGYVHDVDG